LFKAQRVGLVAAELGSSLAHLLTATPCPLHFSAGTKILILYTHGLFSTNSEVSIVEIYP
jgi:hypothetical protein